MRTLLLPVLLLAAAGCASSSPAEPGDAGDRVAFVAGDVRNADGAPLAVPSVSVSCAGGAVTASLAGDGAGRFGGTVYASRDVLGGEAARIPCRFTADGAAAVRRDTTVGFGPPGLPHPLQLVDLRAAPVSITR